MNRWGRAHGVLILAAAAGIAYAVALVLIARARNGYDGFPLDDAWIHLNFARTLREHGVFAYFPGDPATAGSTSPLYTLLLAGGFFATSHEKVLSYALGLASQLGFLLALGGWARARLASTGAAAIVVLLCGLDARIGILSVSGMETSLFLGLLAATFWAWAAGRPRIAAVAAGLAVWVRPEGLILAGVLAIDAVLARRWDRGRAAALFVAIVACYAAFNLATGGGPLPNTFAAKTAYYAEMGRFTFLRRDAAGLFVEGAWIVLAPFLAIALGAQTLAWARREPRSARAEAGWLVALPLAYLVALPFAHRFARYLVPALPAAAILGVGAARDVLAWTRARRPATRLPVRWAAAAALVLAAALHVRYAVSGVEIYRSYCAYHHVRHERCGLWLAQSTPADAVIATHDIGAIAYYSRRRVVDIAGLVFPEAIAHLGTDGYTAWLAATFDAQRVSRVAVLRTWLEVDNVEALWVADPAPEILEVYPWIPGRTHLIPAAASRLEQAAARALVAGEHAAALGALDRAIAIDPGSARLWLLSGHTLSSARRPADAEAAYRRSIALFPDSPEARLGLASVLAAQGRKDEARELARALRGERRTLPRLDDLERALR